MGVGAGSAAGPRTGLQNQPAPHLLVGFGGSQKLAPDAQFDSAGAASVMKIRFDFRQTGFLRPRARRRANTKRPPLVAMRARKPWRRLRTRLLG